MSENIDTRFMGKEFLTGFIEIYKTHPALWKTKSNEYSNKNLKQRGYEALIEYSKTAFPCADRNFVFKKIQNLRGCFRKELKKVVSSRRTGTGTDDVYEPRLWYFELLLFTSDQELPVQSRESQNLEEQSSPVSLNEEENDEETSENVLDNVVLNEEDGNDNENTSELPEIPFRKPATPKKRALLQKSTRNKKKQQSFQEQHQEFMKTCTEVLQGNNQVPDEFEAVGVNVTAKLRKMNPMQQLLAESLINKVLTKGLFEELTRSTDVTDAAAQNSFSWQTTPITTLSSQYNMVYSGSSSTTPSPQPSPTTSALSTYYSECSQDIAL